MSLTDLFERISQDSGISFCDFVAEGLSPGANQPR